MTEIHFQKWQATGNDFVIVDNRNHQLNNYSSDIIRRLCDRKFGVGADGFMLLENCDEYDFEMKYFNADGIEAEMCGNGARSIIGFASELGIISDNTVFKAVDGIHHGEMINQLTYRIKMADVNKISRTESGIFLNTGVPHLVIFTNDLNNERVYEEGKRIRYSKEFAPQGTNVNFIHLSGGEIKMRTYERGVENETLSCGTGAVAACLATIFQNPSDKESFIVNVPGGSLKVSFKQFKKNQFSDIYLEGEAQKVFTGTMAINDLLK